jgi:flagellar motor switch protein FliG
MSGLSESQPVDHVTDTLIIDQEPPRQLSGADRAAALLLAVGAENASKLLPHLGEEDIRAVARSASRLGAVPQAIINQIAGDFLLQLSNEGGLKGSGDAIEGLLSRVLPPAQVRQIMADVRARMNEAVWPRLEELPPHVIAQFLNREHPQVITFVLSKLRISFSAEIVPIIPNRNEVMRRMLTTKLVTQGAIRLLEQTLRDELILKVAKATGQNSHERVAKIVNRLNRKAMEDVLQSLETCRPKEAEMVRNLMFTFSDIAKMSEKSRIELFENIEADRIAPALLGLDDSIKELILSSMPTRTRRNIEQELANPPRLTEEEIETARREVADVALKLSEQGIISLNFADGSN